MSDPRLPVTGGGLCGAIGYRSDAPPLRGAYCHCSIYPRSGFMHIDLGPARRWGEPFPPRPIPFAVEAPPARERLADSRTLKGGGAAGVATIGRATVELAENIVAETQGALEPLIPFLDTLRWLFIALALAGIAVAICARLDDCKHGQR